ncbi:hypothetical protein BGZ79_002998, partial [Entomortierella chlamydospora]
MIEESPVKRRRSLENWKRYTAADGNSVDLPPYILDLLKNSEKMPDPRTSFQSLLNVKADDQITSMDLGQKPKFFGGGFQGHEFIVTEQMMEIWEELERDSQSYIKKYLSGPMGIGKSYISWFLAAMAYACGWLVLYIADANDLNNRTTEADVSELICQLFLSINKDILTASELNGMVVHESTANLCVSSASRILTKLLQSGNQKTLFVVDEHGALFPEGDSAPKRFPVLGPLKSFSSWNNSDNARVVFIGTAKLKEPSSEMRRNTSFSIKDEIVRITNRVPRELINVAKKIGKAPLTLQHVEERLKEFQTGRKDFLYETVVAHYNSLPDTSKESTNRALAKMFLPGRTLNGGTFDWKFIDFGIVYRYLSTSGISVLYSPITPAASEALLDLYKICPLPDTYRNGLQQNNLTGDQFEDALFRQLIKGTSITLNTTDLAGRKPLDICLNISGYELMQQPPRRLGVNGMDIPVHDVEKAKIELAFSKTPGTKNQIEKYLDGAYGGSHEATMITEQKNNGQVTKTFVVKKDGIPRSDFKILYIHGKNDRGKDGNEKRGPPNHTVKVKEFPDIRHICFDEIRSKLERVRQAANLDRVLPCPLRGQEVFVVLKLRLPQPLHIGGYRLFSLQRKTVDRTLNQFITDHPELDAAAVEELRFDLTSHDLEMLAEAYQEPGNLAT